jgi:hypothetical protein
MAKPFQHCNNSAAGLRKEGVVVTRDEKRNPQLRHLRPAKSA